MSSPPPCSPLLSTEKAEKALASTPAVDLSLPKDGKIHINVNLGNKGKEKKKEKSDGGISAGLGGLKLAPPPTGGSSADKKDKKKDKKEDAFGAAPAGAGKAATSDKQQHATRHTQAALSSVLYSSLLTLSCVSLHLVACCVASARMTGSPSNPRLVPFVFLPSTLCFLLLLLLPSSSPPLLFLPGSFR